MPCLLCERPTLSLFVRYCAACIAAVEFFLDSDSEEDVVSRVEEAESDCSDTEPISEEDEKRPALIKRTGRSHQQGDKSGSPSLPDKA